MVTLSDVKTALGISGEDIDATLSFHMNDVIDYCRAAGVPDEKITVGLVARGVVDEWNYGSGEGKLSEYFTQRVIQLAV